MNLADRLRVPRIKAKRVLTDTRVRDRLIYNNLSVLVGRYGEPGKGLTASELKVFSQNGEDGVLAEIFRRIGTDTRTFVEFGVERGTEGNCIFLADVLGWSGLFLEASDVEYPILERKYRSNVNVKTVQTFVTAKNIESLLGQAQVPPDLDILSIDIDGNDYWVWKAITSWTPRVVVVEYNGTLDLESKVVQRYDPGSAWDRSSTYGASLGALRALGQAKGYFLVHTELTGTNAFFVQDRFADRFADIQPAADRALNYSLQGEGPLTPPGEVDYVDVEGDPPPTA